MVLLVFLESENVKSPPFPFWEICVTGRDIRMGV